MKKPRTQIFMIFLVLAFFILAVWLLMPEDKIDFNTQVKPILNEKCIACHGGVKQSGGFGIVFREDALSPTESGKPAIIPGDPQNSEMILRLVHDDPEERMPYKKNPLSQDEIKILKQWIEEGAEWSPHWSYLPVKEVNPPETRTENSIDHFISEKQKEIKLEISPTADKATLMRRVSLDLIGLPPPGELAKKFMNDDSETAYEILVDDLLADPRYGERWTALWLDLARYADTKGYERDDSRNIWRYRDWLIRAFNEDKPYDQFIIEQIAGDLLPSPSDEQYIATSFHRNTMTNDEGGTDNEEFRVAAVIDRTNTTWEVLMGTTFACIQCHGHPYDPIRHEEYYEFMAFFNNTRDEDTFDDYPVLRQFKEEDSLKLLELKQWLGKNTRPEENNAITRFVKTWQPSVNSLTSDEFVNSELADTKWLIFRNHGQSRLCKVDLTGKNTLIYRYRNLVPGGTWSIRLDSIDGPVLKTITMTNSDKQWNIDQLRFQKLDGVYNLYFTYDNPWLKKPEDSGLMFDWFHFTTAFPGRNHPKYQNMKQVYWDLVKAGASATPIVMENPADMARGTHVFDRGNWLTLGPEVRRAVPDIFPQITTDGSLNRLELAKWIVNDQNPLTSRIMVNRLWEQLFGKGIVVTLEDFGSQGSPPTHPELLDYLAWTFMHDHRWSIKKQLKQMVMSDTYRQRSIATERQLSLDPENNYYARGPRVRLSAEQLRDQALAVSGLLSDKMYGPSVMPYQPEGIWVSPYNGRKWVESQGDDRYRRAIYTYWKRTNPYPSMVSFDAMAREVCTSRRINTNTPLQALVTLNDDVFVEAAAQLADKMLNYQSDDVKDKIKYGYQEAMLRSIDAGKLSRLMSLYHEANQQYRVKNVDLTSEKAITPEKSALILVANVILNLDEFITKN